MIILCLSAITLLFAAGAWWNTVQLRRFDERLTEEAMLAEAKTSDRPSQELNELLNKYLNKSLEEEKLMEALREFNVTTRNQLESLAGESSDPELRKLIDEMLRELEDPTAPKE